MAESGGTGGGPTSRMNPSWKDADFELITADAEVFQVPTYILQASSFVRRLTPLTVPAQCSAT